MPRLALSLTVAGLLIGLMVPAVAQQGSDPDPQARPRITIHPRNTHPGPYAKRYCRSQLVKEFRVSGPVIVPHMQCWWR